MKNKTGYAQGRGKGTENFSINPVNNQVHGRKNSLTDFEGDRNKREVEMMH